MAHNLAASYINSKFAVIHQEMRAMMSSSLTERKAIVWVIIDYLSLLFVNQKCKIMNYIPHTEFLHGMHYRVIHSNIVSKLQTLKWMRKKTVDSIFSIISITRPFQDKTSQFEHICTPVGLSLVASSREHAHSLSKQLQLQRESFICTGIGFVPLIWCLRANKYSQF